MERISLFEEYRLIERSESEVNGAWKGAHLLLFFMAFVFGSFCTFCFHMLMYLFDEKCVLFPKLQSLTSVRHSVIYEFIPNDKDTADMLPLDFLSTQWPEKSACHLPTYVPLVSGIFGLVWTTMFLMCSTGSRTLTGLQRPWRVLPPVFVFSLAMGILCTYSSVITHSGLQELCLKLGEITGSATCTYTVNVATLAYERRIRGVYQATRLTILTAWLHTACWLLSALLTLVRVIMVVDFQLVRVNVELVGDIDQMLERHEEHMHTVSPDVWYNMDNDSMISFEMDSSKKNTKLKYVSQQVDVGVTMHPVEVSNDDTQVIFMSPLANGESELALTSEERFKTYRLDAYDTVRYEHKFIIDIIYDVLERVLGLDIIMLFDSSSSSSTPSMEMGIVRQHGQAKIQSKSMMPSVPDKTGSEELKKLARDIRLQVQSKIDKHLIIEIPSEHASQEPSTSKYKKFTTFKTDDNETVSFESNVNLTPEMKKTLSLKTDDTLATKPSTGKKSNLKNVSVQTDTKKSNKPRLKVLISESANIMSNSEDNTEDEAEDLVEKENKETQTDKKKEKQD